MRHTLHISCDEGALTGQEHSWWRNLVLFLVDSCIPARQWTDICNTRRSILSRFSHFHVPQFHVSHFQRPPLIVTHPTSSSSTSVAAAAAAANVNVTTSAPSGGQWRDKHDITQRRICYSLHCCRHHQSTQRDAIGAPTCCLPDQGRLDIGSISRRPWPDPTKQSRLCRVWLAV